MTLWRTLLPMKRRLPAAALLIIIILTGCQTRTSQTGRSRFQVLEPVGTPPASSDKHVVESDRLIDYVPGHIRRPFAQPTYPPSALAAHAGNYEVTVAITIDETGRVSDVVRSLRGLNLPSPYADEFFEAVKTTVSGWKFEPSHQVYYERGANGERNYLRTEAISEMAEIKFTFEASGTVR